MLRDVIAAHTATGKPAGGLRSPRLREIRAAAGYKQSKLLFLLQQTAPALEIDLPPVTSLKRQVSRWENGAPMSAEYRRLFCRVYDRTEAELGFAALPTPTVALTATVAELPTTVLAGPTVGPDVLSYLRAVFAEYTRADNLLGPHHLKTIAVGQLDFIGQLLRSARGTQRTELLGIAARFAEFAGWLHQDAGDLTTAAYWSGRASEYAHELSDPWLTSYIFMRRSNIATDMHDPGTAIGLAEAALRDPGRLTPGLRAVALRQRAHAAALWNDRDDCLRAIDAATAELVDVDPGGPESDMTTYCTPAYIAMETASCWVQLGHPDQAIPMYEGTLTDWPRGLERDRGLCLSRLAVAHAAAGNTPEALHATSRAATAVRAAHSTRAVHQLYTARTTLAAYSSDKVVADVDQLLAGLV